MAEVSIVEEYRERLSAQLPRLETSPFPREIEGALDDAEHVEVIEGLIRVNTDGTVEAFQCYPRAPYNMMKAAAFAANNGAVITNGIAFICAGSVGAAGQVPLGPVAGISDSLFAFTFGIVGLSGTPRGGQFAFQYFGTSERPICIIPYFTGAAPASQITVPFKLWLIFSA